MDAKRSSAAVFVALLCVLALAGCTEYVPPPQVVFEPAPEPAAPLARYKTFGRSVRGRSIMGVVLGEGNDTTFILATIHGDESAGTPLLRGLSDHLRQHPDLLRGRRVVVLPVANPDGMALNRRFNANGVDLNRNFRTGNRTNSPQFGTTALSEPEARAIAQIMTQYAPDRIVSVHQPLACVDYDGPAQALAGRMAQQCGLPVRKLGAKPGSLGSYAGLTLGTPIVTLELPQDASRKNQEELWQQYGKALLAAIVYPERTE
ncbi:MAG: DUF2817 domain-containing protein [Phycisphaerales bacterium]|nr:MAG: DUF2817 domain-containing protein [Phycisphaerales bacterium]